MYNFCFYIYSLTITIEISYIRSNQFIKLILLVGLEMYAKRGHMHPLNNRRGINYFASDWKCLLRGDKIKKKMSSCSSFVIFPLLLLFSKMVFIFFLSKRKIQFIRNTRLCLDTNVRRCVSGNNKTQTTLVRSFNINIQIVKANKQRLTERFTHFV